MAEVLCERVTPGPRESYRTVSVRDAVSGQLSYLWVDAEFLTALNGKHYLPVGVVQRNPQQGLVLIELPQDPLSGSTRLWARLEDLLEPARAAS